MTVGEVDVRAGTVLATTGATTVEEGGYKDLVEQDRRLTILRMLAETPGYELNGSVVQMSLEKFAHRVSRDRVIADFGWLSEQGLVKAKPYTMSVWVAQLTQRGLDVVEGRVEHPGVKRPSPGG